ncbi:MAG: hypothetical protein ACFB6R_16265 [Alphaproteobacteria bacterium]
MPRPSVDKAGSSHSITPVTVVGAAETGPADNTRVGTVPVTRGQPIQAVLRLPGSTAALALKTTLSRTPSWTSTTVFLSRSQPADPLSGPRGAGEPALAPNAQPVTPSSNRRDRAPDATPQDEPAPQPLMPMARRAPLLEQPMPQRASIALSDGRTGPSSSTSLAASDGTSGLSRMTDLARSSGPVSLLPAAGSAPTPSDLRLGTLSRGDADRPALERLTRVLP